MFDSLLKINMHPTLEFVVKVYVLAVMFMLATIKDMFMPLYRLLFAPKLPLILRTPEKRFEGLDKLGYKFKPNYLELPNGCGVNLPRVHYLDEGDRDAKEVILCVHGEPSWSFLYRNMIPGLVAAGYRVVAPDFIGFGKSDKYTSMDNYTEELHLATLRMLIESLDLRNITLVCQDWGGITGLCTVKDVPDRFSSLVIMNTGLPTGDFSGDDCHLGRMENIKQGIPFLLWRVFAWLCGTRIPVAWCFRNITHISADVAVGYQAPFPDHTYQAGVAKWPLMVPLYRDSAVAPQCVDTRNFLKTWKKPALIMFSDSDPITRGQEKMFKLLLPHAKQVVISGGAHFLQDTHGPELVQQIVEFKETTE